MALFSNPLQYTVYRTTVGKIKKDRTYFQPVPCFANLFGVETNQNYDTIFNGVTILPENLHIAEWFLDKFILPTIPERIQESFKLEPFDDYEELVKTISPGQAGDIQLYFLEGNQYFIPWKKVIVDPSKMSAIDMYVLFSLFRQTYETGILMKQMYKWAQTCPEFPLDTCFLLAGYEAPLRGIYGHSFFDYQRILFSNWQKYFPTWSIKKIWEASWKNSPPFKENFRKPTMSGPFKIGDSTIASIRYSPHWDPDKTICCERDGTLISNNFLHTFAPVLYFLKENYNLSNLKVTFE